jgi:hypothetical protein
MVCGGYHYLTVISLLHRYTLSIGYFEGSAAPGGGPHLPAPAPTTEKGRRSVERRLSQACTPLTRCQVRILPLGRVRGALFSRAPPALFRRFVKALAQPPKDVVVQYLISAGQQALDLEQDIALAFPMLV